MARTIKILVPLEGLSLGKRQVSVETLGFGGESCKDATKAFETAFGTTVSDEVTEDYYREEERHEFLQDGGPGE